MCQKMSDDMLRDEIAKNPNNGSYATVICRSCKRFRFSIDGDARTAKIVEFCERCKEAGHHGN